MSTVTLPIYNPAALAEALREHNLPGQRSKTAITRLRRQRLAHRAEARIPTARERLNTRLLADAVAEIRRRGGETVIHGDISDTHLSIADRHKGQRLLLVTAHGWRHYSRRHGGHYASLAYLYGTDDAGPWAVRVPGTTETVTGALAWIIPAVVRDMQAAGRRIRRQGDVYACEITNPHLDGTWYHRNGQPDPATVAAHRWNPDTRYLTHHSADGRKHRPLRLPWPVIFVAQRVYGMGRGAGRADGD